MENMVQIPTEEYRQLITDKVTAEITLNATAQKLEEANTLNQSLETEITYQKYCSKNKDEKIRDLELRLSRYEVVDKVPEVENDDF